MNGTSKNADEAEYSATKMFTTLERELSPQWVTDRVSETLRSTRDDLVQRLQAIDDGQIGVEPVTVGVFPSVTLTLTGGEITEQSPVIQVLNDYNATPVAPQFTNSGALRFEATPAPDYMIGGVSKLQTANEGADNLSYILTVTKALSRAGFSDGTEVHHYARPGEIRLTATEPPFTGTELLAANEFSGDVYTSQTDVVADELNTVTTPVVSNTVSHPPRIHATVPEDSLSETVEKIPSLPVKLVGIDKKSNPHARTDSVELTLVVTPEFTDMDTTSTIWQKTDSTVVTLTQAAHTAGFTPDETGGSLPMLGVYARPGEIRITRAIETR